MAYAGCSAGVACLNEMTFDSDTTEVDDVWKPGLDLVPRRSSRRTGTWSTPGYPVRAGFHHRVGAPEGYTFTGWTRTQRWSATASSWEVLGKSGIHVQKDGAWADYRDGDRFELALV